MAPSAPSEASIAQLVGMGASRAKAIAALAAKRNDVMDAAEAVFSGEFDHIPDDAEDGGAVAGASSSASPAKGKGKANGGAAAAAASDEEADDGDSDGSFAELSGSDLGDDGIAGGYGDDDDMDDGFGYDVTDVDMADGGDASGAGGANAIDNDAYGAVNMSKDRKVEVIDVQTPARSWAIPSGSPMWKVAPPSQIIGTAVFDSPFTMGSAGSGVEISGVGAYRRLADAVKPRKDNVQSVSPSAMVAVEMTSSEWLRGCPEGGEQALLFGIYSQLRHGPVRCPHCAHEEKRFPELDTDALRKSAKSNGAGSSASRSGSGGSGSASTDDFPGSHPHKLGAHLLLMFPRAEHLVEYLLLAAHAVCSKCGGQYCGACAQKRKVPLPGADDAAAASPSKSGKGKAAASAAAPPPSEWTRAERQSVLYHCGAMQSAILGCGLAMVQKMLDSNESALSSDKQAAIIAHLRDNVGLPPSAVLRSGLVETPFSHHPDSYFLLANSFLLDAKAIKEEYDGQEKSSASSASSASTKRKSDTPDAAGAKKGNGNGKVAKTANKSSGTSKSSFADAEAAAEAAYQKALAGLDDEDDYGYYHGYATSALSSTVKKSKGTGYSGGREDSWAWKKLAEAKQKTRDDALESMLRTLRQYLPDAHRVSQDDEPAAGSAKGKGKETANGTASAGGAADGDSTMDSENLGFETDWLPDATTLAHLRRRFLPVASKLLSNDSLSHMIERESLFMELLRWFDVFAKHEALCPLLAQPIMKPATVVPHESNKDPLLAKQVETTYEGSAGPLELTQSIVAQCRTFKSTMDKAQERANANRAGTEKSSTAVEPESAATAASNKKKKSINPYVTPATATAKAATDAAAQTRANEEAEQAKWYSFCDRIVTVAGSIESHLRKTKGDAAVDRMLGIISNKSKAASSAKAKAAADKGEGSSGTRKDEGKSNGKAGTADGEKSDEVMVDADEVASYEEWVKPLLFDADVDMQVTTSGDRRYQHIFERDIAACQSTAMRRTIAISKELSNLQSSLPALFHGSVLLRRDEERVDVLKACIMGPEGSPYDSGCYLFDIFLPAEYNQQPPKCKIVNTGGGQYRHNPNLYADGKVCLSLLGTWSGPGWSPGQSTLLQVLLSIQSLVLSHEPALNEPGWEVYEGKEQSKAYTRNVRRMTVFIAMISVLKNPPLPWKKVIEGHFIHKRKYILKLLDKWLAEDDGKQLYADGASVMHGGSSTYLTTFTSTNSTTSTTNGSKSSTTATGEKAPVKMTDMRKHVEELKGLLAKLAA